jgi:hypothetical protein
MVPLRFAAVTVGRTAQAEANPARQSRFRYVSAMPLLALLKLGNSIEHA